MPCQLLCLAAAGLRLAQSEVSFGRQHVIDTATAVEASLIAADVDNDGYLDVVPANADSFPEFVWYRNLRDGDISSVKQVVGPDDHQFVVVADLNQDGIADIIASSYAVMTSLRWYPGQGDGVFGSASVIKESPADYTSLDVADFDGDGRPDIVVGHAHSGLIQWYRNQGNGTFDDAQEVGSDSVQSWYVSKVFAVDLTGDAMVDILQVSMGLSGSNKISMYKNFGGGSWSSEYRIALPTSSFIVSACISDLNGDGFLDIVYADTNSVTWFKNNGGDGTFVEAEAITRSMAGLGSESISAGDLDGDGDIDLLVSASNVIYGYENDGQGAFNENHMLQLEGSLPRTADLTNDGKLDVLAVTPDRYIVWYENLYTGRSGDDDPDTGSASSTTDDPDTGSASSTTGAAVASTDASGVDSSASGTVSSSSTSPKSDTKVSSTWAPGPIISNNGHARSPAVACLGFVALMASAAF